MNIVTKRIIADFCRHGNVSLISNILLRMQEEDNVSEELNYCNCFRAIRNMAAHEPDTLLNGFIGEESKGRQRRLFKTANGTVVVLDMVQFAVWMMDMYMQTGQKEYMDFLKAIYHLLYPHTIERFSKGGKFKFSVGKDDALLSSWYRWSMMMYLDFGTVIPISSDDPYILRLYNENRKIFWKVAVPDMMTFTCFFVAGRVDIYDKDNIAYFIELYSARDGGVQDGNS